MRTQSEQIPGAPWPVVSECYGEVSHRKDEQKSCPQCDGSHEHEWIAWHDRPDSFFGPYGVPVRCRVCGGRKCDHANCLNRRHHRDPHVGYDGSVEKVGA